MPRPVWLTDSASPGSGTAPEWLPEPATSTMRTLCKLREFQPTKSPGSGTAPEWLPGRATSRIFNLITTILDLNETCSVGLTDNVLLLQQVTM